MVFGAKGLSSDAQTIQNIVFLFLIRFSEPKGYLLRHKPKQHMRQVAFLSDKLDHFADLLSADGIQCAVEGASMDREGQDLC